MSATRHPTPAGSASVREKRARWLTRFPFGHLTNCCRLRAGGVCGRGTGRVPRGGAPLRRRYGARLQGHTRLLPPLGSRQRRLGALGRALLRALSPAAAQRAVGGRAEGFTPSAGGGALKGDTQQRARAGGARCRGHAPANRAAAQARWLALAVVVGRLRKSTRAAGGHPRRGGVEPRARHRLVDPDLAGDALPSGPVVYLRPSAGGVTSAAVRWSGHCQCWRGRLRLVHPPG